MLRSETSMDTSVSSSFVANGGRSASKSLASSVRLILPRNFDSGAPGFPPGSEQLSSRLWSGIVCSGYARTPSLSFWSRATTGRVPFIPRTPEILVRSIPVSLPVRSVIERTCKEHVRPRHTRPTIGLLGRRPMVRGVPSVSPASFGGSGVNPTRDPFRLSGSS